MGLDVYLYHSTDRARHNDAAAQLETEQNRIRKHEFGGKWAHQLSAEGKTDEAARLDERMKEAEAAIMDGVPSMDCIEEPSKIKPDHLFKIGYLRSSYNGGGLNNVMTNFGLPNLNSIFPESDSGNEYEFSPDWNAARTRCVEAIHGLEAILAGPFGRFYTQKLEHNMFVLPSELPHTEAEAMEAFAKNMAEIALRHPNGGPFDGASYSNKLGEFSPKGMKVVGIIPGAEKPHAFNVQSSEGYSPVHYVIVERAEDDEGLTWYLDALKITLETIDHVLSQTDPENFLFHWSG